MKWLRCRSFIVFGLEYCMPCEKDGWSSYHPFPSILSLITCTLHPNHRHSARKIFLIFIRLTIIMWTCPACHQQFVNQNCLHSCNEKSLADFLTGKSEQTIALFDYLIDQMRTIGEFVLHPAKHRIAFASKIRFGYIQRLGKNYIDVVFQFREAYEDNFCFFRIARVPGTSIYNHYCRICRKEDINNEVRDFMKKAFEIGDRKHLENRNT